MDQRLAALIDEILRSIWSANPTSATSAGIHDYDDRLVDCAPDAIEARLGSLGSRRQELDRLVGMLPELGPDDGLDVRVLRDALEVDERLLREVRAPFRDPSYYLDEILYGIYLLIERQFAPLPERARSAARRARAVPDLLKQARANLSDPGAVPREWVTAALQQVEGGRAFLDAARRELAPQAGSAGADLERALTAAAEALSGFGTYLRARILSEASGRFAVGRDLFNFLLRVQHGIDLDADALHDFGTAQVSRCRELIGEAARAVDPRRSWQDLVAGWKEDHPTEQEFLAEYRREVERAREFVQSRGLATLPEGEQLRVVETPSFQTTVTPFAAYMAPAPFESAKEGFLWVTPPPAGAAPEVRARMLQDHLRPSIPTTVVHETYPGHHLQLSVACRIPSRVRRYFGTSVLVEGWAFYCEEMMAEQEYYRDPRSRVMLFKDQLWRACRVVIDVGLQTRGMTAEAAADMLCEVARLERPSAAAEVLRYTRTPTQPMSYAVGKQAILNLREDLRSRLGPVFDLGGFHDRFLSFGSIPVGLIRGQMMQAPS